MNVDVCVIGGGPAGMYSAFYSASRRLTTVLLEGNAELGGRLNWYLDMAIYDIPGQYGLSARCYIQQLKEQLAVSNAAVLLEEPVLEIEKRAADFLVRTANTVITAKTIIAATGNGFSEVKQLPGGLFSANVCYVPPAIRRYAGKVAIIGHTPMAVDWAIQLKRHQNEVGLYSEQEIRLQPLLMEALAALEIPVKALDQLSTADYSEIFCHIGTRKKRIQLPRTAIQLDNGLTDLPGYFVAGDARHEPGKLKLIHGATHDAMQAVNAAYQFIHREGTFQPIVSTHEPIFKEWGK